MITSVRQLLLLRATAVRCLGSAVQQQIRLSGSSLWSAAGAAQKTCSPGGDQRQLVVRSKHSRSGAPVGGVKGAKGRQFAAAPAAPDAEEDAEADALDELTIDDNQYDSIAASAMHVTRNAEAEQHVYVIQPYVKWGARKVATDPELQLREAEALVGSLPNWRVAQAIKVPLDSLDKKHLLGTGKLQEIRMALAAMRGAGQRCTCMFFSKATLSGVQKRFLERFFGLPVMDRYSMVIQILRLHATSREAKLQVAAAEIPYIWSQMRDGGADLAGTGGGAGPRAVHTLNDAQKEMLRARERKLRQELRQVRSHRELLRQRRQQRQFPIVAIVGYTNAGKTALIRALTADADVQPRNQLFATLDVTAHAGQLPSKLRCIYMDTVGFMGDLPSGLLECFVATLEDAMLADVVVHVQDVSHPCRAEQADHVQHTLRELAAGVAKAGASAEGKGSASAERFAGLDCVINVGNKADLLDAEATGQLTAGDGNGQLALISAKTGAGVEELRAAIEAQLLRSTNRARITMRVPMGGPEASWLYKNAAVTEAAADPQNAQNLLLSVIIHETQLQKFRHQFVTAK